MCRHLRGGARSAGGAQGAFKGNKKMPHRYFWLTKHSRHGPWQYISRPAAFHSPERGNLLAFSYPKTCGAYVAAISTAAAHTCLSEGGFMRTGGVFCRFFASVLACCCVLAGPARAMDAPTGPDGQALRLAAHSELSRKLDVLSWDLLRQNRYAIGLTVLQMARAAANAFSRCVHQTW